VAPAHATRPRCASSGRPEGSSEVICPNCGAEYQRGFTRCSDCLVDLVEPAASPEVVASKPEPRKSPTLASPVCVYRATLRGHLPLAESLLRSAGIPFAVAGEHVAQLTGIDGYGVAEVFVAGADADDARALLADLDRKG